MIALFVSLAFAAAPDLLTNSGFADGLSGWVPSTASLEVSATSVDERTVGRITVPEGKEPGYPNLSQPLKVSPGDLVCASADARSLDVKNGAGAYMVIEYFDADGKRVSFSQSNFAERNGDWTQLRVQGVMPAGAVTARIALILNGTGRADFDSVAATRESHVVATAPPDGPVTITITDKIACDNFRGFGVEDDGWFYNPENASHGVTEEDIRLREQRIESMGLDWVRMFFWYKDWNPSGDWETFSFNSPNMDSHYRTLDLYQRLGVRVDVVGVEWGIDHPYGNPEAAAHAIGALFEHLVKDKGYTCVKEWTLTNEPNGYFVHAGYDFDRFVQLHQLVRAEFDRRGLDVQIVGSDESNGGFLFFEQCVEDDRYFGLVDHFASHRYFPYADRVLAPSFFSQRLDLLAKKNPRKDLVVAEFGFQDSQSSALQNPIMETYPYAVWTAAFVIEGLNRGVAGFSIWCLHEVYYPGNGFMNYGLWDYKDNGWKVRPVYYVWRDLGALTHAGEVVHQCESTNAAYAVATLVNDVLVWVNRSKYPVDIRVKRWQEVVGPGPPFPPEIDENHPDGRQFYFVRVRTKDTLPEGAETGSLILTNRPKVAAPPMSFGYIRNAAFGIAVP